MYLSEFRSGLSWLLWDQKGKFLQDKSREVSCLVVTNSISFFGMGQKKTLRGVSEVFANPPNIGMFWTWVFFCFLRLFFGRRERQGSGLFCDKQSQDLEVVSHMRKEQVSTHFFCLFWSETEQDVQIIFPTAVFFFVVKGEICAKKKLQETRQSVRVGLLPFVTIFVFWSFFVYFLRRGRVVNPCTTTKDSLSTKRYLQCKLKPNVT